MFSQLRRWLFGLPWDHAIGDFFHRLSIIAKRLDYWLTPPPPYRYVQLPSSFDQGYGVDTAGQSSWWETGSGTWTDIYGSGHEACPAELGRRVLAAVPDAPSRTFVDLGCGKGRVLVIASEFPFKAIIGVEKAQNLARIASANARIIRETYPDRTPVQVENADASAFVLPPGDVLIFMANPFWKPAMRRLLQTIESALREPDRRITILYYCPYLRDLFDHSPLLIRDLELSFRLHPADEEIGPWHIVAWHNVEQA